MIVIVRLMDKAKTDDSELEISYEWLYNMLNMFMAMSNLARSAEPSLLELVVYKFIKI